MQKEQAIALIKGKECNIKENFITCTALDKSKIGCVYCNHFCINPPQNSNKK